MATISEICTQYDVIAVIYDGKVGYVSRATFEAHTDILHGKPPRLTISNLAKSQVEMIMCAMVDGSPITISDPREYLRMRGIVSSLFQREWPQWDIQLPLCYVINMTALPDTCGIHRALAKTLANYDVAEVMRCIMDNIARYYFMRSVVELDDDLLRKLDFAYMLTLVVSNMTCKAMRLFSVIFTCQSTRRPTRDPSYLTFYIQHLSSHRCDRCKSATRAFADQPKPSDQEVCTYLRSA